MSGRFWDKLTKIFICMNNNNYSNKECIGYPLRINGNIYCMHDRILILYNECNYDIIYTYIISIYSTYVE